jgi:hypothetical protein
VFTSVGASRGGWAAITTGASTWLLDAGRGEHTVRILYVPALVAVAGLGIAVVALAVTIVLWRSGVAALRPRGLRSPDPPAAIPAPGLFAVGLGALLVPAIGGIDPSTGEFLADVLWCGLLAVAALGWVRRPRSG